MAKIPNILYLQNITSESHIQFIVINCEDLPISMNGEKDNKGRTISKGCPGAVWTNGNPSETYCKGDGARFPWWKECCKWTAGKCSPKG